MVPAARQRVRLSDRGGVYLVLWVDRERGVCDLLELSDIGKLIEQVPWGLLRPEDAPSDF